MPSVSTLSRLLLVALAAQVAPAVGQPGGLEEGGGLAREVAVARAAALFDGSEPPADGLVVVTQARADPRAEATEAGGLPVTLGVWATRLSNAGAAGRWALTLVANVLEEEPWVRHEAIVTPPKTTGLGWVYLADLELPLDLQDAVVVVEERDTGRWGAGYLEVVDELPETPSGYAMLADRRVARDLVSVLPTEVSTVVQLVAPAERPLRGRTRFRAVVTRREVAKVVFHLDGEEAAVDEREPFQATLDLGAEPRAHRVRVEAFASNGEKLGEDARTINRRLAAFGVRIVALDDAPEGRVRVRADVSVPPGEELERVEFFRNETLAVSTSEPPFLAELAAADGPTDYVRVVATLAGGRTQEDARLFNERLSERIEVNLVEVYAVVTDRKGDLVDNLERDSFRLRRGRREVEIERFALAEEVPLVLGLMIDSSLSMWTQMVETRQAAARFVASTLRDEDRAFIVDFDSRPRVAQGLTGDVTELLRSLGALAAGGTTAIYDATSFSLNQFETEPGRRALVLLTDGQDAGSSLSAVHCAREAQRLGVPLYVLVLSPEVHLPSSYPRNPHAAGSVDFQLEALARETGGRLFVIEQMDGLDRAYEQINAELRSQYLLAFSTHEPLGAQELSGLRVEVEGRGLKARTVTLSR